MESREEPGLISHVRWFVRRVGLGVLAGTMTAALVGGLGSRIAMRIIALAAGPLAQGQRTGNGNAVGDITAPGTIGLVTVAAIFFGVSGGLVYAAIEPSLRRFRRWRGLIFGLGLLAVFGATVIEFANRDFRRFATPELDVALFAVLFPLYGVVIAPMYDALGRWFDAAPWGPRRVISWILVSVAASFGILLGIGTGLGQGKILLQASFLYAIIAVPGLRQVVPKRWEMATFVPLAAGVVLTIRELVRVVSA